MGDMNRKSITHFLAYRLLFSKNNNYSIKIVAWVCLSAIAVGSFALTLIFAIMQGLQTTTESRLQNIHPQIIIQAPLGQILNFNKIKNYLDQNTQISACTPYALSYGILHNPDLDTQIEFQNISLIKAINPQTEKLVSQIGTKIEPQISLDQALTNNQIIIGKNLAQNLGVKIGDQIDIFVPNTTNFKNKSLNFQKIKAQVGALIKTGISEFDDSLIVTSLDFMEKSFPNFDIHEIGLKLKPNCDEASIIKQLRSDLKLTVFVWKDLYLAIIAALKLEKYTGLAIAILIILIASMTLIALLFMLITKHTGTIAILTILGLAANQIRITFILISFMLTTVASFIGIFLAAMVGLIIKKYPFINLPDAYYLSTLPVELSMYLFICVYVVTITIALIASQIPLKLINRIKIATILKSND